jgi:molybdate transport system substrate-binding protein
MKNRLFVIALLLLFSGVGPTLAQEKQSLTVFAAASLTDAFNEIAAGFKKQYPGVEMLFSFGNSATLATQISQGAPADVFASANEKQMKVVQAAGNLAGEPAIFVKNRLVLVVPLANPAQAQSLKDLAKPGVKLILAAPGAPVRDYADAMLDKLAQDAAYGPDYKVAVLRNLVSEEDTVRGVAAKVALGEADAGMIYRSDVTLDLMAKVRMLPIPDAVNTIVAYPIAVVKGSPNAQLAQAFMDYVLSDAGQAILKKWNFLPLCKAAPEATPQAEVSPPPEATAAPETTPTSEPDCT